MKLKNFLKMHQGGGGYISIHQLPYDDSLHRYTKTYHEEERQSEVLQSETYKTIKDKQVHHFNVISGYDSHHPTELCIYLEEEEDV